jgi:preprotein translocase subunit SecG
MMMKRTTPGKRILCFLFTVVILFLGGASLHAEPKEKKVRYDTASVVRRDPSPDQQKEYNENEVWRYDRDKTSTKSEPTVFDRMWNGFWDKVMKNLFSQDNDSSFNPWTILWILLFAGLIVLVILKVTGSGVNTLFSGKSRTTEKTDATLEDVDIHAIDYEKQIRDAIANNDYRLAVRLWFLRTLKTFSDKELVHWKIDKTNSDYYYELSGTAYQKEFGEISNVYDYIWYGEFPVDQNSYTKAEEKFSGLMKKLK